MMCQVIMFARSFVIRAIIGIERSNAEYVQELKLLGQLILKKSVVTLGRNQRSRTHAWPWFDVVFII